MSTGARMAANSPSMETAEPIEGTPTTRVLWFIFWNLLSFGAMWGIFIAVRDMEWWNGAFHSAFAFFSQHATIAVLAALMPFFASLLVGWGYARRARLRRLRNAALAESAVEPA